MSAAVEQALNAVHEALNSNNQGLDEKILQLKQALSTANTKEVVMDQTRLPQNNRQGRKMLQTYFRKRGVVVVFKQPA